MKAIRNFGRKKIKGRDHVGDEMNPLKVARA
jgi:hypothetical protein